MSDNSEDQQVAGEANANGVGRNFVKSIGLKNSHDAPAGNSDNLSDALAHTAVLNNHRDVIAGIWDLAATESQPLSQKSIHHYHYVSAKNTKEEEEALFKKDMRKLVDPADFKNGGKYRAVVKLFLQYEGQGGDNDDWAMGTGWLIAKDLLVTAGHCAYDWEHSLGALTKAKVYMGYAGQESVGTKGVQFRHVKRVATPAEWLKGPTRAYDVSFMMLDKPFDITEDRCIQFADTPDQGTDEVLGVVGYPGDLDHGEKMYAEFKPTTYNLANENRLLCYMIDTFGGNSGSPVFRQKDLKSIGVHAYGGAKNQASVIGPYGNEFGQYIRAIRSNAPVEATSKGIGFLSDTATRSSCKKYSRYDSRVLDNFA